MNKGKRKISEGFYRFMAQYLFEGKFCNPGSGNEKGSVEGKVGYHRRNYLVPIPEFKDILKFNKALLKKADEDMNRQHYRKKRPICELFQEELDSMNELPPIPYDVCRYTFLKADKCGRIRFENNSYSTSPKLAGRKVRVKVSAYYLYIYDNRNILITRHKRLYGKGMEAMDWIPYLELLSKRPTAFKYTDIYEQLPETVRTYLDGADYKMKKEVLGLMSEIAMYKDMSTAVKVLRKSIAYNVSNIEGMRSIFYSICSKKPEPKEVSLSSVIPELKEYTPDLEVYDKLFPVGKGGAI
jgi:hypothetical protein